LSNLAVQVGRVTERKRAAEALYNKTELLNLLHEITTTVNETRTAKEAMQICVDKICSFTGWPIGHVYITASTGTLVPSTIWHIENKERFKVFRKVTEDTSFETGIGLPGRVLATGKPAWIRDVTKVPWFLRTKPRKDIGVKAAFAFPVLEGKKVVAVLEFFADEVAEPDGTILEALSNLAVQIGRVTERKRAEEERHKMEEKLRQTQKLESLGVLAGGIAHDFNNILTGILGNTEFALDNLPPDSPARSCIEQIQKGGARAAELSNQMLAYSGKGKFIIKNTDVNEIIKKTIYMLKPSISKNHPIKYDLTENLPSIEVDVTQIGQVIINLLINASEAIGENKGVISVSTSTEECGGEECQRCKEMMFDVALPKGQYVVIEVADTGEGMDKDAIEKIFDPFYTTKLVGRGLGMPVVLGIISGHKGAINIESKPGKGTKFTICLPSSGKASSTEELGMEEASEPWRGSGTVLVVDDEETVRTVAKRMLGKIGFTILTAGSGHEAIEIFRDRTNEIDGVLLDLTMPIMNGEECFHELRKIRKDIRVIIFSGFSNEETANRFIEQGVNGFLQKPFNLKTLRNKMRKVFESNI
jgi:signal transduction histidine kinase/CheY-like chemotaxis protein